MRHLLWFNMAMDDEDPILAFAAEWVRQVARRVDNVTVITMRAGCVVLPANVRLVSLGKEDGASEPLRALRFFREMRRITSRDRPDAAFSHMTPVFSAMAAPSLRLRRIPLVTWYAHRHTSPTMRAAYVLSDAIVSPSASSFTHDARKLIPLGHGIDLSSFAPTPLPSGPPLLLSVGRVAPIKDLVTLVRAIEILHRAGHDVRARFVGPADLAYLLEVRRAIADAKLEDRIDLAGPVYRAALAGEYAACFAHVNLCPTGGLDKAPLEAMASGRPALVANEGFRETMGEHGEALLFRHGDPKDLAERLDRLLRGPRAEAEAIGIALRERVDRMHALDSLLERLLTVLHDPRAALRGR